MGLRVAAVVSGAGRRLVAQPAFMTAGGGAYHRRGLRTPGSCPVRDACAAERSGVPVGRTALVEDLRVAGRRLSIRPGLELRALLSADPWADYPADVDLASVPRSVLLQTAT